MSAHRDVLVPVTRDDASGLVTSRVLAAPDGAAAVWRSAGGECGDRTFLFADGSHRAIIVGEQHRPLDFAAEFRLLPLEDDPDGALLSDATELLAAVLSTEGLRKATVHVIPTRREEGWVRAVATAAQPEGRMRSFFRHGDHFFDDLLLSTAREPLLPSQWSPDGPLVDDTFTEPPWVLPVSVPELATLPGQVRLVPTYQMDPADVGQLEMRSFVASRSDGFGVHVLDPLVGHRPAEWDFGVVDNDTGHLLGRVGAVGFSERALHCGARVLVDPEAQNRHVAFDASILFLHLMFRNLPLRKVYFDLSTPQTMRFAETLGADLSLEAHLVDDYLLGSVFVDRFIWSINRAQLAQLVTGVHS